MLTDEGLVQRGRGSSRGRALPLGLWRREPLRLTLVLEVPAAAGRASAAGIHHKNHKDVLYKKRTLDGIRTTQGRRRRRRGLPAGEMGRASRPLWWGVRSSGALGRSKP
jgi:hypothetical protein